jgi:hypothetical protein
MTAKAKAKELIDRFFPYAEVAPGDIKEYPKQCALICAEQCRLEAYKQGNEMGAIRERFWYDVISELETL